MRVFAPGKLVLTGAYAVLEGAPAIVLGTSRGAYADASRTSSSPTPEVRAALGDVAAPHVDASSLFLDSRKLGLGASAAIVVASLAAGESARGVDLSDAGIRRALFDRARAAHAIAQDGGSGVDVAASVYGGVLEYTPGKPIARTLPHGTAFTVFACGTSARTTELRAQVGRLASTAKLVHSACMRELSDIASYAARSVRDGARDGLIDAIRRASRSLARLGAAAGAPIVPEGFASLEEIAAAEGGAFCVSGAGGGDVATYVGAGRPSAVFMERAMALGLFAIDVHLDEKGVRGVSQPAAVPGDGAAFGIPTS